MEIYIMDVRAFDDEALFERGLRLLLPERRAQLERLRGKMDKWRCMGAGLLLEYGLRQRSCTLWENIADKQRITIVRGQHGKLYPVNAGALCFNLSHSGAYAAAVFADSSAGIDVEAVRPAKFSLAKRFFRQDEYAYLQAAYEQGGSVLADAEFTRLWTRKESYIKAVGEGMHLPLADFSVLSDTVSGSGYQMWTCALSGDYVLTVCAGEQIKHEVQQLYPGGAQFWNTFGI